MNLVISRIIGALLTAVVAIYTVCHLNDRRISIVKLLLSTLILGTMLFLNSFITIQILKPFIAVISLIIISYFIINLKLTSSIFSSMTFELVCIISENIIAIVLLLTKTINLIEWYNSPAGMIFFNSVISALILFVIHMSIIKKLYNKFIEFMSYLSYRTSLVVIIISFILVVVMFYVVYYWYYTNALLVYITIVLMFAFYTFIMLILLKTAGNYEKIKGKYTLSMENLKSYEEMLDQYRIANHENKNQLLLVRNLSKDRRVKEYIDELIDNKEKDDSNVYNALKRIPDSSIRAVIYSKILLMNNKNINYSMRVDRKVSSKDFANIPNNLSLDICNILNIFIDNAIDEVSTLDKKQILMEITKIVDDEIEIAISNTCKSYVDISNIYGMGYSTKGENHGYGLSIVKNTINNNRGVLENKFEKVNNIFTQYLYIKLK